MMSTITFPVDLRNPGQFFACCGIAYFADRVFESVQSHFDTDESGQDVFILAISSDGNPLEEILIKLKKIANDLKKIEDENDSPLRLDSIYIDFWNHFDDRPSIKLFAGQERSDKLLCRWLDHLTKCDEKINGLLDLQVQDLPSGLDTATSWNALDAGFSLDKHNMNSVIRTNPFVEFFAYLGIQTYSWKKKARKYRYHVWTIPLSITVSRVIAAGSLYRDKTRCFEFNTKKNGQKKVLKRASEVNT